MKNSKSCSTTACCWAYRHQLLGLVFLVLAAFLTVITCNGLGILAMFFTGIVLLCHKHLFCHCPHSHCHTHGEGEDAPFCDKEAAPAPKKAAAKAKK